MTYTYDNQNIFAKILRGEIPNDTVFENEHVLAFNDINPKAPVHVLVIPKGPYVTYDHFANSASDAEIVGYSRAINHLCKLLDLTPENGDKGYRAITNAGSAGAQEVPHFHTHILGGRNLGCMLDG
jgi:histidine triad (HIT) family protein